jgi:hypothetical protein
MAICLQEREIVKKERSLKGSRRPRKERKTESFRKWIPKCITAWIS